jgi:superfamily II DNA or RNA helicase
VKLTLETPAKLRITEFSDKEYVGLQSLLSYKDKSVEVAIRRLKANSYYHKSMGQEAFNRELDRLHSELNKPLLFHDDDGVYTLPGLKKRIEGVFSDITFENLVEYPEFGLIPWAKKPEHEPYDYQLKSLENMLKTPHSHVELSTGTGKSLLALLLTKEAGLPTLIVTPSIGLAKSFYNDCVNAFGKRRVGMFGGGKKEIGKEILVCVNKSMSMVKKEEYDSFKKYQVLISDESHMNASLTNDLWISNLCAHIPYRWFLSATQERNDGKDMLLEGIIGPLVYELSIQKAIADGYLAKISTLIFDVESHSMYNTTSNIVKMNQKHFYANQDILDIIGILVSNAMEEGMPTLILIGEHEQERLLRNKLGSIYAYAKGGSDTNKICNDFNSGKIMCVVGTSAVSTGTNFKPVRLTINWKAGKAETTVKQGPIGRSTRLDPSTGKTECKVVDFRVTNIPMLYRHSNLRIKLYKDVGPVIITEYRK